jgi:hypothetical protein
MSKFRHPIRGVSRIGTTVGVLVAATAVTAAVVPAADAAQARSGSPVAVIHLTGPAARRITCEMVFIGANGGVPHHSGHVPGTINVRVRVTCDAPISTIRGKIGLFSTSGTKINPYGSAGRAAARGNAALVCRPGYYVGASTATLVAPPGYSPPTATLASHTAEVHITRC